VKFALVNMEGAEMSKVIGVLARFIRLAQGPLRQSADSQGSHRMSFEEVRRAGYRIGLLFRKSIFAFGTYSSTRIPSSLTA
jgi:hypothetical protein